MAKTLFVEIYQKDYSKLGFVEQSVSDMREVISPFIKDIESLNSILFSLQAQLEDHKKFPNVVIFLDENNKLQNIDQYISAFKRK